MTERPILFSGPMVRALLAGTKTQTRRAMKPQPSEDFRVLAVEWYSPAWTDRKGIEREGKDIFGVYGDEEGYKCPYAPGDRLWVRETWAYDPPDEVWAKDRERLLFRAGYRHPAELNSDEQPTWKPSIFMPRWASRLALEVAGVRVEQLNEISEDDVLAEGITHGAYLTKDQRVGAYRDLWRSINGPTSWEDNPWVWVIEFNTLPSPFRD